MSLDSQDTSTTSSGDSGAQASTADTSSQATESKSTGYSVTDPGYDAGFAASEDDDDETSTTEENPSEGTDDASGETTEETAETPTVDDDSASANEDGISDEVLDRASELGYTLQELRTFKSEATLLKDIERVEKLQQRLLAKGKPTTKTETKAEQEPEPEPEPDWEAMVEAGHDPEAVEVNKKTWQRLQRAEAAVRDMAKAERERAWIAQCERFDDALNTFGDEYKSILGEGRRGDLLKTSPEAARNREQVFKKMIGLRNLYEQTGDPMPSERELIQEAVHAAFWKQTQKMARGKLTNEIKKAGSQALSRPRSAGTKQLVGADLASAKEADFWKKFA